MFKTNLLCFRLYPLPPILSLGTTEKSLGPFSFDSLFFRVKQVVNNIMQRPALELNSCEWKVSRAVGNPSVFETHHEQVQNPDKLAKYLQKVCCHPGNFRETQITVMFCGLAHAYRAPYITVQCSKGEEGGSKAAGTATGADPQTGSAAASAREAVTEVAPAHKKEDAKKSDCPRRKDNKPGSSQDIQTEVITRSLCHTELQDRITESQNH